MNTTTLLAYGLIVSYFVVERSLRKGSAALSLKPQESDAGSSVVLAVSSVIGLMSAIAAPILNYYQIGNWQNSVASWLGIMFMLGGLGLRYWAAKTLGEFYTRTLQTIDKQQIVESAPYSWIRHPGYLGTLLLSIGAGLALSNWLVIVISVPIGICEKLYRISAEEKMLASTFLEQFETYKQKTWRLIPYLY